MKETISSRVTAPPVTFGCPVTITASSFSIATPRNANRFPKKSRREARKRGFENYEREMGNGATLRGG
jgi:hypothetical protein